MSTAKKQQEAPQEQQIQHNAGSYAVIKHPVITEKSYTLFQNSQYSFVVSSDANKTEVKKAIEAMYGVKVQAVRISRMKPQKVFVRGKRGTTSGYKKAIVSLRDGYSINI